MKSISTSFESESLREQHVIEIHGQDVPKVSRKLAHSHVITNTTHAQERKYIQQTTEETTYPCLHASS